MAGEWWVMLNGETRGPFSTDEMQQRAARGALFGAIIRLGEDRWMQLEESQFAAAAGVERVSEQRLEVDNSPPGTRRRLVSRALRWGGVWLLGVGAVVAGDLLAHRVIEGPRPVVPDDEPTIVDGRACASGRTVKWGEGRLRCATETEAEWLTVCPGGDVRRGASGIYCGVDVGD